MEEEKKHNIKKKNRLRFECRSIGIHVLDLKIKNIKNIVQIGDKIKIDFVIRT